MRYILNLKMHENAPKMLAAVERWEFGVPYYEMLRSAYRNVR